MQTQNKNRNIKKRKAYQSDLTNKQWEIIAPLIPPAKPGGRSREVDIREILNAAFYLTHNGCRWRAMPHDFPKWCTVYYYFREWKNNGTWKNIHTALREKVRKKAGRNKQPSAGIIDSQSVKTSKKGGFVAMTLVKK